jgi:hypothetical protein
MPELVRFKFERCVPLEDVEDSVLLAICAAEGLHGAARVRLDARYELNAERHMCFIAAGNEVGESVAKILTGFLIQEFGEDAFAVARIDGGDLCDQCATTPVGAAR